MIDKCKNASNSQIKRISIETPDLKYKQILMNPELEGELITVAHVDKPAFISAQEKKEDCEEESKSRNVNLIDCKKRVAIIGFWKIKHSRPMCYRQLSVPDPLTVEEILNVGAQGDHFIVFDLPTTPDQCRDRRVAVLDLKNTSEEIGEGNEGIEHIARHCKQVFKLSDQSLLAKAIDRYENSRYYSEKLKCLSFMNFITVEAKSFLVFGSKLSLVQTTSEFAQAGA